MKRKRLHEDTKAKVIVEKVHDAIDIDRVKDLHRKMCRLWGKYTSSNHNKYNEYKAELKSTRNDLAETGYKINELDELIDCNWNRVDRDNPRDIDTRFASVELIKKGIQ